MRTTLNHHRTSHPRLPIRFAVLAVPALLLFDLCLVFSSLATTIALLGILTTLSAVLAAIIALGLAVWYSLRKPQQAWRPQQPQPAMRPQHYPAPWPQQHYPATSISVPVYQPKAIKPEPVYVPGSKRVAGWQYPDGHIIWDSSQPAN
jgi:hypothetical protein